MIPGFENIVEERIKKAQEEGQFDNLKGMSKPIRFEEYKGPEEFRMAYKILKNAGFLPPEVELRKKIHNAEQLLEATADDSPDRAKIEKKLRLLLTRLDAVRQDRSGFSLLNHTYRKSIEKKLS